LYTFSTESQTLVKGGMPDNFEDFDEGLRRVAENAKRFDTSMGHSELSIRRIIASFIGADVVKKAFEFTVAQSAMLTSMKKGLLGLETSTHDLVTKHKMLSSDMRELTALSAQRIQAGQTTLELVKREEAALQSQLRITQAQVDVKKAITRFHPMELTVAAITLKAATELYHTHRLINTSLIEANSSMHTRVGLTRDTLVVQQLLGSELGVTRDAARELVNYGYDLETSFADNLKLVTQMHDGIGMSVAQGAELVAVYDRQLKSPVRSVADSIARIVNDTGLAADQAGRLATNIGRAIAALRPGISRDLAGVNELVGRYEGALQELGGQFGQFGDLLTRMTTPEGMMQAGMLGVSDPTFLASKNATKQVVDSFAAYAKSVLGDSQGWDRALRLNVIAEQFGLTGQQANLMIMAVDRANKQRTTSLTLEERYREQIRASGESLQKLKNSLYALMQQAVVPLIPAVTFVVNGVASLVQSLVSLPGAVYVVGTAMVVTTALMIPRIWSAVAAFAALTGTLIASARAAQAKAVAESAQLALPGLGSAATGGTARVITTALPKIVRFLGVIAGAFAIGWSIGEIYNMIERRASRIDPKFVSELKTSYDEALRTNLQHFAASGDVEGIRNAIDRARGVYTRRGQRPDEVEARLARLTAGLADAMGTARFRKEVAESSIERDPATVKASADLAQAQVEMINIADDQRAAALKQIELQKEQNRKEEERKEEEIRRFRLQQNRFGSSGFLKQAYGY
jgi:hypothetical protein